MSDSTPFRLACDICDGGDEIQTLQEAELSGWRFLRPTSGGPATHVGTCPVCEREDQADPKGGDPRYRKPNTPGAAGALPAPSPPADPLPIRLKPAPPATLPEEEAST